MFWKRKNKIINFKTGILNISENEEGLNGLLDK